MKNVLRKIPGFIRQTLSEENGLGSSRRLCFVAAVAVGLLMFSADVAMHQGLRSESNALFAMLLGATAGAIGVGMFSK